MSRELKKFGLRPARTPATHRLLSGTVYVVDAAGRGYAYVHFDEAFVQHVGLRLSKGLHPDHPGYIKAMWSPALKVWRIMAMYLDDSEGVLLWETADTPRWLAKIRRK